MAPSALFADAEAVIEGPDKVNPGDLVMLDGSKSTADNCEWVLVNSDKFFYQVEENRKVIFASGTPGEYVFILVAAQSVDDVSTVSIEKHVLTVEGKVPDPPKPPKPDNPEPTPDLTGLSLEAYKAASKVDRQGSEASDLANGIRSVTSRAAGLSWDENTLNEELSKKIRSVMGEDARTRWSSFNQWFGSAMSGVNGVPAAIEALDAIAEGLDALVPQISWNSKKKETLRGKAESLRQELDLLEQEVGP